MHTPNTSIFIRTQKKWGKILKKSDLVQISWRNGEAIEFIRTDAHQLKCLKYDIYDKCHFQIILCEKLYLFAILHRTAGSGSKYLSVDLCGSIGV